MIAVGPGGEVLRGMQVELQPLRVGRARAPVDALAVPAAAPAPARDEEAEREAARAQAERAGYAAGLGQGLADAQAQRAAALEEAIAQAVTPLRQQQERLAVLEHALRCAMDDCLEQAEDDMVALCYQAVCRIVAGCALAPETVRAQLQALALAHAGARGVAIHVHPQDAELLQHLARADDPGPGIRWQADPDVTLGGCIVRSESGGIDARLDTALVACRDALLALRAQRARKEAA